jgi:hypothetical protein
VYHIIILIKKQIEDKKSPVMSVIAKVKYLKVEVAVDAIKQAI